jgi:hypothetical protein
MRSQKGDRALPIIENNHYSEEHVNAAKRRLRRGTGRETLTWKRKM